MEVWKKKLRISSASLLWFMVPFGSVILVMTMGGLKGMEMMMSAKMSQQSWLWPSLITNTPVSVSVSDGGGGDDVVANVLRRSATVSPPKEGNVSVDFQTSNKSPGVVVGGGASEVGTNGWVFGALNHSASPPTIDISERELEKQVIQNGQRMNSTAIDILPLPLNESKVQPSNAIIRKRFSKLERLEAKMQRSRGAIRDAKTGNESLDTDYIPRGPMYWNAKSFHRSYLEMEKHFKVFVYEEGEQPIFHNGPCASIYSMEGYFINQMENSPFRTRDPHKAYSFFLPFSVTSIVRFIYEKIKGDQWYPMKQTVKDYINLVSTRYSYWNRSLGTDHIMLSCHDWGPELSKSVPELYRNSVRALCNANTTEGFNPAKDISIPEINLPKGTMHGLIGGPSASKRPVLVFFAGGLHGPIRPVLLEHWENKEEDVQIHKYLPKGVSYYGMLKKSRFCICASGYEVASPRMVEAIYTGCVPVLIKDGYIPPFSDVLNWKSFAVIIPVNDIPNLKKILSGISSRQYIRMQQRGKLVRRHFEVNFPPKRYDVFHMTLHSIWLRRLNIRLHGTEEL